VQTVEATLHPVQKGDPTMPNLKERILIVDYPRITIG
jgi:hypothetical protein